MFKDIKLLCYNLIMSWSGLKEPMQSTLLLTVRTF